MKWPQQIPGTVGNAEHALKKLLAEKYGSFEPERLFLFQPPRSDHPTGDVLMAQYRVDHPDGGKSYHPWTFWNDNEWRQMEPEGPLPLYGLEHLRGHKIVFLHEGTKAARHAARLAGQERWPLEMTVEMIGESVNHPWLENLKYAAHLGWIGGAPNPNRTDWSALKAAGVARVFIVSDNDEPGLAAFEFIA